MIAEVGRSHPRTGWDDAEDLVRFQARAIEMSGTGAGNFVDCMEAVGSSRFDAVETFIRAKHSVPQQPEKSPRKNAKGAGHVTAVTAVTAAPPPTVSPPASAGAPTERTAAPGNVVHPERPGDRVPPAPRPGPDIDPDRPAVVATGEGPSGNPGVRRDVHRPEPKAKPGRKPKPVEPPSQQDSLF